MIAMSNRAVRVWTSDLTQGESDSLESRTSHKRPTQPSDTMIIMGGKILPTIVTWAGMSSILYKCIIKNNFRLFQLNINFTGEKKNKSSNSLPPMWQISMSSALGIVTFWNQTHLFKIRHPFFFLYLDSRTKEGFQELREREEEDKIILAPLCPWCSMEGNDQVIILPLWGI